MKVPKATHTVAQNQAQPCEVAKPKFVQENVQREKQIFQDEIRHAPGGTEESVDVQENVERRIELPQVQFGDQMGEGPIQVPFQVPMVTKVQMMVEVPQAELVEHEVPKAHIEENIMEAPKVTHTVVQNQVQHCEGVEVVEPMLVQNSVFLDKIRQAPQVQVTEVIVDQAGEGPALERFQVPMATKAPIQDCGLIVDESARLSSADASRLLPGDLAVRG